MNLPSHLLDSILLGDCRDQLAQLPDEAVDLVGSSPPYNLGKEYESRVALEHYVDDQRAVLEPSALACSSRPDRSFGRSAHTAKRAP